jgi:hypothetical protein
MCTERLRSESWPKDLECRSGQLTDYAREGESQANVGIGKYCLNSSASPRCTLAAFFSRNPLPDKGGAVAELGAVRLAASQKRDSVLIHELYSLQVKYDLSNS